MIQTIDSNKKTAGASSWPSCAAACNSVAPAGVLKLARTHGAAPDLSSSLTENCMSPKWAYSIHLINTIYRTWFSFMQKCAETGGVLGWKDVWSPFASICLLRDQVLHNWKVPVVARPYNSRFLIWPVWHCNNYRLPIVGCMFLKCFEARWRSHNCDELCPSRRQLVSQHVQDTRSALRRCSLDALGLIEILKYCFGGSLVDCRTWYV